MPKKHVSNEDQIIDLLQKQLIFLLYRDGVTRDQIKKILSISSGKVSEVIKYLSKSK
jgi:DNA-directed RNA polymerase specialized sigma subunit